MNTVTMHIGDVRDVMAGLEDGHADLIVTSPPFLALRSYLPADHPDKAREIGSEPTPAAFLDTLYGLSADWGRLLPEWGSLCVELGDTMSGSGGAGGDYNEDGMRAGQPKFRQADGDKGGARYSPGGGPLNRGGGVVPVLGGIRPLAKSMMLIPHSYTIGLAYGLNPLTGTPSPAGRWRIRNVITWARPNPPVGSLGRRNPAKRTGDQKFRPACSFITVACRGTGRYFDLDAVRTEGSANTHARLANGTESRPTNGKKAANPNNNFGSMREVETAGAPPLDWHADDLDGDWLWKLATAPYPGSHYATYPLTLPRRLVLAMCPERVCTVCGWPSERETGDVAYVKPDGRAHHFNGDGFETGPTGANRRIVTGADNGNMTAVRPTTGWTDCGHDAWRPAAPSTRSAAPAPPPSPPPSNTATPPSSTSTNATSPSSADASATSPASTTKPAPATPSSGRSSRCRRRSWRRSTPANSTYSPTTDRSQPMKLAALALPLLLAQCDPACDPTTSDAPQFAQQQAADAIVPGDCASYAPLFAAYNLPVQTFARIAWRESGCNHRSYVIDSDDAGGGLLGINLKGSLAAGWFRWCGVTLATVTDAETNVRCAAEAYQRMGLQPWQ